MPGKLSLNFKSTRDTLATHKVAGGIKVDGRLRQALANPEIARKAAKAATTRGLNRGWTVAGKPPIYSYDEAHNLKKGVTGMLTRIDPSDPALKAKIEGMDQDKLAQLYYNNKFVFEVFFNYEGVERSGPGGSLRTDPSKRKDADFLVKEYERAFGEIWVAPQHR